MSDAMDNNNKVALSDCFGIFANKEKWLTFKEVAIPIGKKFDDLGTMFGAMIDSVVGNEVEQEKASQDMDSLKGISAKYKPGREARDALEKDILQKLRAGKLLAYGHSLPRGAQDNKVPIPHDVWINYPSIKWEKNKVKGQGLEFINVVVSDEPIEESTLIEHAPQDKVFPTKKQGRPTVRPDILEAYIALRGMGKIDFSAPKTAIFNHICDWLENQHPDRKSEFKSLDDSTIRKAISNQFDEDRSKQT